MSALLNTVSPARAFELLERDDALVIDVREPAEREAGYLAGSLHIEMTELAARAESLPRDRPILFYCRSGSRSAMAMEAFRDAGYDAYNLEGGIEAWSEAGMPTDSDG